MENMLLNYADALRANKAWDFIANNLDKLTKEDLKAIAFYLMEEIDERPLEGIKPSLKNVATMIEFDYEGWDD